ncbi:GrpB family protein [Enterococcus hulanensis]|uniref:GrpB family protein n=1 Tax=Enterococcus hulanensis TaxID=2559929 RepID=A0ABU3F247_9ENTE|nr:GrpB family protein [Enterococcus hulanensis]MDT2600241.1 GrpB family protein [Enterococcus hulanensis]MDT2609054.1 GrpB family protein [Enterococcus hulanensis]MDT2616904.1 GrpB family protein [Enterococcus hulanensis]MDT2628576.1 GrpB family protein [Enterococcus hulanensis]MDT2655916.1 GrpB family protein [Enterococcus hulanensis]
MKNLEEMTLEELWELFPIILKEHRAEYADWYEEEQQNLTKLLAEFEIQRINHIGSTSVEGLIAKPIVDILLELPEGYDLEKVTALLEKAGWILMIKDKEKQTLDLNKGYTPAGFAEKVYHLHVRALGDWDELYFRDYLQKYPEAARQYEELKLSLKEKYEHNRDAYTDAKTEFVEKYSQKAREEFGTRHMAK